jgi:hypothetical protein
VISRARHRTYRRAPQIVPTELNLTIVYMPRSSHTHDIKVVLAGGVHSWSTWETSIVPP